MSKTKLIAISGCTNSGKTTLSKKLLLEFPNSFHLSQDDFYHKRDNNHYDYIPELNSYNFDVISAIDMKKFHKELNRLVRTAKYDYIFLDGILLYEDEKLYRMVDKRYFIDLDKEECSRRRQSRQYTIADTSNYFDRCAWIEYLKYREKCKINYKGITYLSGRDSPDYIFKFVLNDLL